MEEISLTLSGKRGSQKSSFQRVQQIKAKAKKAQKKMSTLMQKTGALKKFQTVETEESTVISVVKKYWLDQST